MNPCDDVADALSEDRELTAAQAEHTRSCAQCKALVDIDASLEHAVNTPRDDEPPAALKAAIAADNAPVSPFVWWRRALVPLGAVGALAALALVLIPRRDLTAQPFMFFGTAAIVVVALACVGFIAVLHRGARGVGVPAPLRAVYALATLVTFVLVTVVTTRAVEGSVVLEGDALIRSMWTCGTFGLVSSTPVGVALFVVARRSAPVSPALVGAVAGVATGMAAALIQHLACPVAVVSHALVAHSAPALIGAAVGALLGRRLLAP